MADAIIEIVGQEDLPTIVELYNRIYRPARDITAFRRRFLGRHNVLQMIARIEREPVGFFLGFELKPTTFFAWFCGVLPEYRQQGVASQLMEAVEEWAKQSHYESIRLECHNSVRPMLQLAIKMDYNITGMLWEHEHGDNLVIFEKMLETEGE
ncbi:MAG: GNAT family N-acetyltransferase [Gemmataceae bacterium]